MRWLVIFGLLPGGSQRIAAQVIQERFDEAAFMESFDAEGKPFSRTNSARNKPEGSPMLNPGGGSGIVWFADGKRTPPMDLQFNLQKNLLTFREGGSMLGFAQPVRAFRMIYIYADSLKDEYFRNGYPPRQGRSDRFFYQVLEDGPMYQLLAERSIQQVDAFTYLGGEKQAYKHMESWYLYDVRQQRFHLVRPNRKQPLDAGSELKSRVQAIASDSALNLKKPGDWPRLVRGLNGVK
jgi:hypothetical protein